MLSNIFGNCDDTIVFKELHFYDRLTKTIGEVEKIPTEKVIEIYAKLITSNNLEPWNVNKSNQFIEIAKSKINSEKEYHRSDILKLFFKNSLLETGKNITIEHTPKNAYHINDINQSFKEYNLIHIFRDPRATLISQKNKWKRYKLGGVAIRFEIIRLFFIYYPIITCYIYRKTINKINNDKKFINPNNLIEVKYENVLENPKEIISEVFRMLDIKFLDEILSIGHSSSSFVSKKTKKKGIDASRSEKWKDSINSAELFLCQLINKRQMETLGYEQLRVFPNLIYLSFYLFILPFQSIIIAILNFKRVRSILVKYFK